MGKFQSDFLSVLDERGFIQDISDAEALDAAGAERTRKRLVDPLRVEVATHGFFGFRMDIREDSEAHTTTLAAVCDAAGIPHLDRDALVAELLGRRPLAGCHGRAR